MFKVYQKAGQKAYNSKIIAVWDNSDMANKKDAFKGAFKAKGMKIRTKEEIMKDINDLSREMTYFIYLENEAGKGVEITQEELEGLE